MILVTGFGPFADNAVNPSQTVAHNLAALFPEEVAARILPVTFDGAPAQLRQALKQLRPRAVLSLGLDASAAELHVERVAINLADARVPDNDGAQPRDLPLAPDGPAAYFATLPTRRLADAIAAVTPARLSYSAGTYVCNATLYAALHAAPAGTRCGFVHLPPPTVVPVETATAALARALEVTAL